MKESLFLPDHLPAVYKYKRELYSILTGQHPEISAAIRPGHLGRLTHYKEYTE